MSRAGGARRKGRALLGAAALILWDIALMRNVGAVFDMPVHARACHLEPLHVRPPLKTLILYGPPHLIEESPAQSSPHSDSATFTAPGASSFAPQHSYGPAHGVNDMHVNISKLWSHPEGIITANTVNALCKTVCGRARAGSLRLHQTYTAMACSQMAPRPPSAPYRVKLSLVASHLHSASVLENPWPKPFQRVWLALGAGSSL